MTRATRSNPTGQAEDDGFTLIEVTVAMVIFSIFLAIFAGAIMSTFHSVYRTQQTADAETNLHVVYSRLDPQVRYSDGISSISSNVFATGDYVVAFSNSTSGQQVCTQLRFSPQGTLWQRNWVQPSSGAITMGTATALGSDLVAQTPQTAAGETSSSVGPFAVFQAGGRNSTQRLEIAVSSRDASQVSGSNTRSRSLDTTFDALNTSSTTSSANVCSAGLDTSYGWPAG